MRTLLALLSMLGAHAADQLPPGYVRGEYSGRVMVANVDALPHKRQYQWEVVTDITTNPAAAALQPLAASSKIHEMQQTTKQSPKLTTQFLDTTWYPKYTVTLVIDLDQASQGLISEQGVAKLTSYLSEALAKYPDPSWLDKPADKDSKTRLIRLKSDWSGAPEKFGQQMAGEPIENHEQLHYPTMIIDPVIRTWQADEGCPYAEPKNAIAHVWIFHDYVAKDDLASYLKKRTTEFTNSNAVPSPAPHYTLINLTSTPVE